MSARGVHELLLIEDEPADASLVHAALAEAGVHCRVHHVCDGEQALGWLRQQPQRLPDLVLLDLNMPRCTGRELLVELKADARWRRVPVVVLSTSEAESDIAAAYALGAAGYLSKPVDLTEFVQAIALLGRYWFGLVRLPRNDG